MLVRGGSADSLGLLIDQQSLHWTAEHSCATGGWRPTLTTMCIAEEKSGEMGLPPCIS